MDGFLYERNIGRWYPRKWFVKNSHILYGKVVWELAILQKVSWNDEKASEWDFTEIATRGVL